MKAKSTIAVVAYGDYSARQADRLGDLLGPQYRVIPVPDASTAEEKARAFEQAVVIVSNRFSRDEPPTPALRLLQSPSAGMEQIDLGAVPAGCEVRSVGGHEIPMAEFALCAMLDWRIRYKELTSTVKNGLWTQLDWIKGPTHSEVYESTVGLVGYGRVAREIATRAAGFSMRRLALSRWKSTKPGVEEVDACFDLADWKTFASQCDFIVVTLPYDRTTRSLINEDWFNAMKLQAVLINQARGPVVDEKALFEALRDCKIGGAVIDVWYRYPEDERNAVPIANHPFHTLTNVVISPHASGRTPQMFNRRWAEIARNIQTLLISAES